MKTILNSFRSTVAALLGPAVRFARGVPSDSFEVQYLKLIRKLLSQGTTLVNPSSHLSISVHGAFIRVDVSKGFPALTTRKLAFKSDIGELVGSLRAKTNAADFRALGCMDWDHHANEDEAWLASPWRQGHDSLGDIYGAMWRRWPAYRLVNMGREDDDAEMVRGISQLRDSLHSGYCAIHEYVTKGGERMVLVHKQIDQLRACLDSMIAIPSDRRMMISGWNPALLGTTASPSCHHTYNWSVHTERSELSLAISMGSTDLAGSLPSCVASGAALMAIVERLTGLKAKWLSVSMADAYLCQDQLEMVREQLRRIPKKAPTLVLSDRIPHYKATGQYAPSWLDAVHPSDFSLRGYEHHAPLNTPMAV